ncbi:MAG: hypothetical protein KDC25_07180 [Saprospiraceae bacterium]|nr:hypothetical protein [Saprospiraceae bacterium]
MFFIFLVAGDIYAQTPYCSFDKVPEELIRKNENYARKVALIEEAIYQAARDSSIEVRTDYTIPVVVHIITPPGTPIGTGNNLTDAQVEAGPELWYGRG